MHLQQHGSAAGADTGGSCRLLSARLRRQAPASERGLIAKLKKKKKKGKERKNEKKKRKNPILTSGMYVQTQKLSKYIF